jgi:Tol biopolymer transport system component
MQKGARRSGAGSRPSLWAAVLVGLIAGLLITPGPAGAKVPGPNGQIAFARANDSFDNSFTYTVSPSGGDPTALFPSYDSGSPHWSPNGKRIAVISSLGAPCPPTCTGNTVIINPDTGAYRVLPPQGYPAVATFCSIWSPDASHFACEGGNDSDPSVNGIYTIRSSDGGNLTRITNPGGGRDIPIDYSPDGKRIVFGRTDPTRPACQDRGPSCADQALFVVSVDGGHVRRITPWGFSDDDGSWSPNGSEIVFEHFGSPWVVHPDGAGLQKIQLAVSASSFAGAGDYSWSPNGKKLVFLMFTKTASGGDQEGIATANADGSNVRQITTSPTFDNQPDWGAHPRGS